MSLFIPNAITKEEVNHDSAFCCGQTFGNFEQMLVDLQEPLGETIPNFHNMELRLMQLREAVEADKVLLAICLTPLAEMLTTCALPNNFTVKARSPNVFATAIPK